MYCNEARVSYSHPPQPPQKKQEKETNSGIPNQNNKDKLNHYIW